MKIKEIKIEDALKLPKLLFIDVRSPSEFSEATIPGAINIPLLSDEERKEVGTVYKQQSPAEAKKVGMNFIAPKLPTIIEKFSNIANDQEIVVLCWRGGMRSLTVSLVLNLMGLPVYRLTGGYKAYRGYVLNFLGRDSINKKAIVLHGLTGVGKTDILNKLEEQNLPVIDLEGLAHNRGSVFGWLGQSKPPSQKYFESVIVEKLQSYNNFKYFFIECENKRIGKLFLPQLLINEMQEGRRVLLYGNLESRIDRIVNDYTTDIKKENIVQSLTQLKGRLGKEKVKKLEELIYKNQYREVAKVLLTDYYDPLYKYPDNRSDKFHLSIDTNDITKAIEKLKNYAATIE